MLDQLAGKEKVILELEREGYRREISVYWVSAHGHGGPMVSPASMERMATLGLELQFEVFFANEEEVGTQQPEDILSSLWIKFRYIKRRSRDFELYVFDNISQAETMKVTCDTKANAAYIYFVDAIQASLAPFNLSRHNLFCAPRNRL